MTPASVADTTDSSRATGTGKRRRQLRQARQVSSPPAVARCSPPGRPGAGPARPGGRCRRDRRSRWRRPRARSNGCAARTARTGSRSQPGPILSLTPAAPVRMASSTSASTPSTVGCTPTTAVHASPGPWGSSRPSEPANVIPWRRSDRSVDRGVDRGRRHRVARSLVAPRRPTPPAPPGRAVRPRPRRCARRCRWAPRARCTRPIPRPDPNRSPVPAPRHARPAWSRAPPGATAASAPARAPARRPRPPGGQQAPSAVSGDVRPVHGESRASLARRTTKAQP